jgi:nuclear transcription Y subunit beta
VSIGIGLKKQRIKMSETVTPSKDTDKSTISEEGDWDVKEQDRLLPMANVGKLMKRALPQNAKIAKEAKETLQECVSEFIAFVTSEASDRTTTEKRKTINGEDVLYAMSSLGFDNYIEPLRLFLQKYRDNTKGDKTPTKRNPMDEVGDEYE